MKNIVLNILVNPQPKVAFDQDPDAISANYALKIS